MIYALLFILAFLLGAACYWMSGRWWAGVVIALSLYTVDVLLDSAAREYWLIALIFGLPIVFAASLLGAYVIERARYEPEQDPPAEQDD